MYSIFLQNKCILTGLTEEKFKQSWETLNNLVGIITTNYTAEDLSYEVDKEFSEFPKEFPKGVDTAVDTKNLPGFPAKGNSGFGFR